MPAMVEGTTSNRSKLIRSVIIRFGVVGIILALILGTKKYDWSVYMQEFTAANRLWLVLSFCLLGVVQCLGALRWYFLLRVQDIQLRYSKVLQVNLIGFFFSQFLPSNVGGDAVKIFYAMRQTPGKKANAALSMVMDRVLGLIAILFLTLLMLPMEWERLGSNPQTRPVIIGLAIVLICIFAGLIAGALFPFHRLPSSLHRLWEKVPKRDILETLYTGFHAHGKNLRYTLAAVGAAAATVVPLLSMGWFLARSLNLDTGIGPHDYHFRPRHLRHERPPAGGTWDAGKAPLSFSFPFLPSPGEVNWWERKPPSPVRPSCSGSACSGPSSAESFTSPFHID
jgi:uncharacterized protein (TIRG00374 family)